jgi:hypothetical protein
LERPSKKEVGLRSPTMIRVVVVNEKQCTAADIHEAYVQAERDVEAASQSLQYVAELLKRQRVKRVVRLLSVSK